MKQPAQPDRKNPAPPSNLWRESGKSANQVASSIPLAEIELLLRSASDTAGAFTREASNEELGPGDVQYFRGESLTSNQMPSEQVMQRGWFESTEPPDELLKRAENPLSEAMSVAPRTDIDPLAATVISTMPPIDLSSKRGLSLEDLGNLDLDISIELGRTELLIEEVLSLREGSVVSLDKLAGDPVDILANGRLVARGELLVIEGKFGVRLSEVL